MASISSSSPGSGSRLCGPNGSGKTTVLRCLAGTVTPTEGRVTIWGHIAGSREARRVVGVSLSQERSFYLRLSGRENLLFAAGVRGISRSEAIRRVAALERELELSAILAERVDRCSTGMVQQLAFARALIGDPTVMLSSTSRRDPWTRKRAIVSGVQSTRALTSRSSSPPIATTTFAGAIDVSTFMSSSLTAIRALVRRDFSITRSYRLSFALEAVYGVLGLVLYYFISRTFENAGAERTRRRAVVFCVCRRGTRRRNCDRRHHDKRWHSPARGADDRNSRSAHDYPRGARWSSPLGSWAFRSCSRWHKRRSTWLLRRSFSDSTCPTQVGLDSPLCCSFRASRLLRSESSPAPQFWCSNAVR